MNELELLINYIKTRNVETNFLCEKIFHGPAGHIPGWEQLVIDRFGQFLFVVTYRSLDEEMQNEIISALKMKFPDSFIRIQYRSSGTSTELFLTESCPDTVTIEEAGLKYLLHTSRGQNTGFFADMKNGRKAVQDYISVLREISGEVSLAPVLNLFAYTCSFSVAALYSGASRVDNWDMNGNSLNIGKRNHEINEIDTRKAAFFAYDIFKSFGKIIKRGPYSLIILDPPPQQGQSFQYRKDYPRLMQRLEQILTPRGAVLFCLNAPDCDKADFLNMIQRETPGSFDEIVDVPCPPEYLGRFPDRGLKTFLASGYKHKLKVS